MRDVSLVLFTLSAQASAGAYTTLAILDFLSGQSSAVMTRWFSALSLLLLCLLLATGLAAAFFHLGIPARGYRGLANLRSSWLSRELLAFSLFGSLVALHTGWTLFLPSNQFPVLLIALTVLSGLGLIWVMSQAYRLRTVPNWNNNTTPISFFTASFLVGTLLALSIHSLNIRAFPVSISWIFAFFGFCALIDGMVGWRRYQDKKISHRFGAIHWSNKPSKRIIVLHLSLLFIAFVLLGLAIWLESIIFMLLSFLLAIISQTASRVVFYQSGPAVVPKH